MYGRRSLKLPIILGVVMIVLVLALTVGWVWVTVVGALETEGSAAFYWTVLAIGTSFLVLVLVGVVAYLTLSIKAINLTKRQSNFIDSVTHELKSPIASLKLYLQTLSLQKLSPEEEESFCRFMLEDVERLDELINHMLTAGRLEKGELEAEAHDVELAKTIRQCAAMMCVRYRVPPETVTLQLQPCIVRARHVDLEIVFRNLIDNALKYAGAEPRVSVSLVYANHQAVARIADNGHGIPHRLRRKIFGRFVRLGLELERQKPGTGLGLYIVRTLVRRLKGDVRLTDPPQGTGSVFEVRLPAAAAKPIPPADHGVPEPAPRELSSDPIKSTAT